MGGVMGGLESSVTASTTDILLECAWFDPKMIRVESRRYGMHTDASHRYERGVDTASQRPAVERATALLLAIVGGRAGPVVEAVEAVAIPASASIRLRASRVARLLGTPVADEVVEETLTRLGMQVTAVDGEKDRQWQVEVPSFRSDVTMEADLIEEVARISGYDSIPGRAPVATLDMRPRPERRLGLGTLRSALVDHGYAESITYSFTDPALQRALDPDVSPIPLSNPISSELSVMRTSLWPGLFGALLHNVNRQQGRVRLFESGLVFQVDRQAPEGLRQVPVIGGLSYGMADPLQWGIAARNTDFFDLKGIVEALIAPSSPELTADGSWTFRPEFHPALHPGQSAQIYRQDRAVGWLGAVHPTIQHQHKLPLPAFVFQLELETLLDGHLPAFTPRSKFPTVRRDIAIVVDEAVSAQSIQDCVGQIGLDVLHCLELFDVYRGEGIDSGRKSVALGLTFQDASRTLRDADVEQYVQTVLAKLEETLQARLR